MKYRTLLIGTGRMGAFNDIPGSGNERKVISYAKALKENGNFDVYCCDIDKSQQQKAVNIWGFNHIDGDEYDVIIITTPDETHYAELKESFYKFKKPKLIICEKPLCMTSEEAEEILELYKNIPIMVDCTRRFIPYLRTLMNKKAVIGHCVYNRGFMHTAIHAVDFFHMLKVPRFIVEEDKKSNERVWKLSVNFNDGTYFEEHRIGDGPVPSYYDFHTRHLVSNAYKFLEGKEELYCTGKDALKALKTMEEL